jgi:hypothetical protein
MITAGNFGTTDLDDLTQGLMPYMLVNHRAQGNEMIVETHASDMDRIMSGETDPSLDKIQQLKITTVDHPQPSWTKSTPG